MTLRGNYGQAGMNNSDVLDKLESALVLSGMVMIGSVDDDETKKWRGGVTSMSILWRGGVGQAS
eukprot:scaffold6126_cov121-Skeletonema_dohrnii-CCMP3373.AAC.1